MKAEITNLPNQTTNGFLKTINSDGTLAVDTGTTLGTWVMPNFNELLGDSKYIFQPGNVNNSSLSLLGWGPISLYGFSVAIDNSGFSNAGAVSPMLKMYKLEAANDTSSTGIVSTNPIIVLSETNPIRPRGVFYSGTFAMADDMTMNVVRGFIGLSSVTNMNALNQGGEVNDMDAQLNCIGFGHSRNSPTMKFIVAGSSNNLVDLGANFPIAQNVCYYVAFYIPRDSVTNTTDNIRYYIKNLGSGAEASGTLSLTWDNTNFPLASNGLYNHVWRKSEFQKARLHIGTQTIIEERF